MTFNVQSFFLLSFSAYLCATQTVPFTPCPLLGPRTPIPKSLTQSSIIKQGTENLTALLDAYVASGNGDFGPITPNITSFSIALFSTEEGNDEEPFFYEYHHSVGGREEKEKVDANSVWPVGDLTSLFTVWVFLIEAGEKYWSESVEKWIPELISRNATEANHWDTITLGDLAAHLGGIGWYEAESKALDSDLAFLVQGYEDKLDSPCEIATARCDRARFYSQITKHAPIAPPGRTPIYSNTGIILLAHALEAITNRTYTDLLTSSILSPLNLSSTSLTPSNNTLSTPFNGLQSLISDLSTALRAILSSSLLSPAVTNRWLKPASLTSNRANSVGRPWEIYSLIGGEGAEPVIPIYQVRGNIGSYSSHVGVAPDYGTGFVILAKNQDGNGSPDLNVYADLVSVATIPALEENAASQAIQNFAGRYSARVGNESASLTIAATSKDTIPGLEVEEFRAGERDLKAAYARMLGVREGELSARLYPVDGSDGKKVFRAVFQDRSALVDAGTPTCETWRYVDELQYEGMALDRFVFEMSGDEAVGVEVEALGLKLRKDVT